jgi:serine/threonine-protein kinase
VPAAPPAPEPSSLIGKVIDGKYALDSLLGRGGMGAVYRGHHVAMGRKVAVKVIHPQLATDQIAARRFVREARGTFAVDSDHAVKVYDFAESDQPPGLLYMVMEHLDGRTVAEELKVDGAMSVSRALRVARQVASALEAAHRVGIIHRDIKPENVMLIRVGDDPDFAKVLDFGLAKLIEGTPDPALSAASLTQHGMVFGTPDYMSPEQATGKKLDLRTDVYALGASLFEMLTGRPLFHGASPMAVLVQHVREAPPHLVDFAPQLAHLDAVDRLVQRCIAKSPDDRPATARDLIAAIDRVVDGLPSAPVATPGSETMSMPALPRVPRTGGQSLWVERLDETGSTTTAPDRIVSGLADKLEPAPAGTSQPVRRRRLWLVAVGGLAFGAGGAGIWMATRGSTAASRSASITDDAASIDAAATVAASVDAKAPSDAAAAVAVAPPDGRTPADARPRVAVDRDAVERLVKTAYEARAAGNRLKQMGAAGEALDLDRRDVQANFLLGDALVLEGDIANGCAHLRRAKSLRAARKRMEEAGCK